MDYSGAPTALFFLAKALIHSGFSVDLFSMRKSALDIDFKEIGVSEISGPLLEIHFHKYDIVLFNTIVSTPLIPNLKPINTKFVLWIHESPYLAGLAWAPHVYLVNIKKIDLLIFPSNACKAEWGGLINTLDSETLLSPAEISQESIASNSEISKIEKVFCIIDPREPYRNIDLIEKHILEYRDKATFNFIGTTPPSDSVLKTLHSRKNIRVNYFGRVSRQKAIEILAESDIYLSATSMATQNRGFCEALCMNKSVYISKINAHVEIGLKAGVDEKYFFLPYADLNLSQRFTNKNYETDFLSPVYFENRVKEIFK